MILTNIIRYPFAFYSKLVLLTTEEYSDMVHYKPNRHINHLENSNPVYLL